MAGTPRFMPGGAELPHDREHVMAFGEAITRAPLIFMGLNDPLVRTIQEPS
jgi:hypothetical protein